MKLIIRIITVDIMEREIILSVAFQELKEVFIIR